MGQVAIAVLTMVGLSAFFGVVLAIANRYLKVEEDPRIDRVEGMLPGSNCGACGQPGCRAFAESLIEGKAVPGKCTVSSRDGVSAIAIFLGVDAGFQEKRVARLHCAGGRSSVKRIAEYRGTDSCRAAVLINGGGRERDAEHLAGLLARGLERGAVRMPDRPGGPAGGLAEIGVGDRAQEFVDVFWIICGLLAGFGFTGCRKYPDGP